MSEILVLEFALLGSMCLQLLMFLIGWTLRGYVDREQQRTEKEALK